MHTYIFGEIPMRFYIQNIEEGIQNQLQTLN